MEKKNKMTPKKILFCIYAVFIVALLVLVIAVGISLGSALQNQPTTEPTQAPTLPQETLPTQPVTDPPPPALPDIPMNRYSEEDFQYDGDYLTCTAGKSVLGIDVSTYQGEINWEAVRDAGIEFAIIRVGGRGWGQAGVLYEDDRAQEYYQGATAAGLKVGAYFFAQAITPEEAAEEAAYALELTSHWKMDMPMVYDWECESEEYRTYGLDPRTLTDCIKAFCQKVEEAGRKPMFYFNPNGHNKNFYIEELTAYRFWLAMYSDAMTYPYHFDMWQYTKSGSVPGINGTVDLNLYLPFETVD